MNARAFTLVEMLVVMAIVAVLAGLLLPALNAVKTSAHGMACGNNLRQIGMGAASYAGDWRGRMLMQDPWGAYKDADPGDHANSNRWHIALLRGGHLGEAINANYLSAKITGHGNPLFRCHTLQSKLLTWNHYAVSRHFSNWDRGLTGSTNVNAVVQPDGVVYMSEFNAADYTAGTGEWRGMWPGALANFSGGGWGRASIGYNHGKAANVLMASGRVDRLGAARLVPASLSTATAMDAGGARWNPFVAP